MISGPTPHSWTLPQSDRKKPEISDSTHFSHLSWMPAVTRWQQRTVLSPSPTSPLPPRSRGRLDAHALGKATRGWHRAPEADPGPLFHGPRLCHPHPKDALLDGNVHCPARKSSSSPALWDRDRYHSSPRSSCRPQDKIVNNCLSFFFLFFKFYCAKIKGGTVGRREVTQYLQGCHFRQGPTCHWSSLPCKGRSTRKVSAWAA